MGGGGVRGWEVGVRGWEVRGIEINSVTAHIYLPPL